VSRQAASFVITLVGAAMLRLSLGDDHLLYVKESMRIPLLVSALALIALGVPGLFAGTRADGGPDSSTPTDRDGPARAQTHSDHDHDHTPWVAWAMLLPVLALLVIAPPALGSFSAARQSGAAPPPEAGAVFAPLGDQDPVETKVSEFALRARFDAEKSLAGRRVQLTGFALNDADGWYVARVSIACCAADGFAEKVRVQGAPSVPDDQWVRVVGTWVDPGGEVPRRGVPVIEVEPDSVTEIEQPRVPYE
jgi:uncharacterized repeat protein (TIGR03943 family)